LVAPRHLTEVVSDTLAELSDSTSVSMYLLRQTGSKADAKKFEVWNAQVEDEIPIELRRILKKQLKVLEGKFAQPKFELEDFFDTQHGRFEISELKAEDVHALQYILGSFDKFSTLKYLHDMSEAKEFDAYAIQFHLDGGNAVYFSKIPKDMILKKGILKGLFSNGRFTKIDGDIMAFNDDTDCIYFTKTNSLIVLDKADTESIFVLKVYYQACADMVLTNILTELVTISPTLLTKVLTTTAFAKRITKLFKDNKFDKKIDLFKKYKAYFALPEKDIDPDKIQLDINDNDKVVLNTDEQLDTFLEMCDRGFVEDIIDHLPLLARAKENITKKTSTTASTGSVKKK
jgi:hypothetical protein